MVHTFTASANMTRAHLTTHIKRFKPELSFLKVLHLKPNCRSYFHKSSLQHQQGDTPHTQGVSTSQNTHITEQAIASKMNDGRVLHSCCIREPLSHGAPTISTVTAAPSLTFTGFRKFRMVVFPPLSNPTTNTVADFFPSPKASMSICRNPILPAWLVVQ
jgi:hypothetical protein